MEDMKDNQNIPEETKETESTFVGQSNGDDISTSGTPEITRDDDTRRTPSYQPRHDGDRYSDENSRYGRDNDRGMGYGSERRGGSGIRKFRKYDKIATRNLDINYKKPEILREFLTEQGKILSRQITGSSAQNQRRLVREVKRARYLGFLPSA